MHAQDIFQNHTTTFSFEFFPPKTAESAESLYETIRELEAYQPHFVSVTYGAGGSTRELTNDLVVRIKETTSLDPVPHLTCVCHKEAEITAILERYARAGVSNILALGGDPPKEPPTGKATTIFNTPPTLSNSSGGLAKAEPIPIRAASASVWPDFPKAIPPPPTGCWRWTTSRPKWTRGPTIS